jgi:phospholipid/cholesterol/gamma-HCH transport system ATP-binding protein
MSDEKNKNIIEIEGLNTWYGDRQILSNISLNVVHKEIMVIMGHSGSGKSTLLRHMIGLNKPESGSIKLLDKEVTELSRKGLHELRKNIGVAFQNGALFSSMTLQENVELPLREHTNLDHNTIRIMSRLKLDLMNLSDSESLMPAELSGGMLKRAGLARAVIMDPDVLFFDEPSAGLDPITSAELDDLILQLRDALNMTIVVVTHELDSAFKIADRITVLDNGQQIITGDKETIRNFPDPRIINMLERKAMDDTIDADDYLNKLTRN